MFRPLPMVPTLLTAVLLAIGPAAAAPPRQTHRRPPAPAAATTGPQIAPDAKARQLHALVNLMDPDGKGYVTVADFLHGRPYAGRLFDLLDRNGDGVVDRREFLAGRDGLRASEFARLDRNKDGRLNRAEFLRGWNAQLFDALSDARGMLTAGDLRPGFSTALLLPPPQAAPPPRPAAAPAAVANPCWYPINRADRWGLVFPMGPGCR